VDEHDRELVRLVKGTPASFQSPAEMAREIGVSLEEAERRLARLVERGRLKREGDRFVAIDPEIGTAPGREIP
jgi:DNA-binding Lrp family transcriptional regulator